MEAVNVFKTSILSYINAFQQNDAFYVEASCLLHSAKQLAGFFMKHCTELYGLKHSIKSTQLFIMFCLYVIF